MQGTYVRAALPSGELGIGRVLAHENGWCFVAFLTNHGDRVDRWIVEKDCAGVPLEAPPEVVKTEDAPPAE